LVAALVTHILGIILAIAGLWVGAVLWAILSATCSEHSILNSRNNDYSHDDSCYCIYGTTEEQCKFLICNYSLSAPLSLRSICLAALVEFLPIEIT
jgi:hypothetical protein